jgi:hypothetical protein
VNISCIIFDAIWVSLSPGPLSRKHPSTLCLRANSSPPRKHSPFLPMVNICVYMGMHMYVFLPLGVSACECRSSKHVLSLLSTLHTTHYAYNITLHHTTPHYTKLHHTTPHYTKLHHTTPHCTTLHYITISRRQVIFFFFFFFNGCRRRRSKHVHGVSDGVRRRRHHTDAGECSVV